MIQTAERAVQIRRALRRQYQQGAVNEGLSLGPDATREAVVECIQSLPADSNAWKLRPCYGNRPAVICEACGKRKEEPTDGRAS